MLTKFSFDHVIIVVEHLDKAVRDFEALGFSVVPGGVHTGNITHNALIPFDDGTYIELLAPTHNSLRNLAPVKDGPPQMPAYLARMLHDGEGLADFALWVHGIEAAVADAVSRGIVMNGPSEGGRHRHDGPDLLWKVALPETPGLPFFIEDVTQRTLRAPASMKHQNGVVGMGAITIATPDVQARSAMFRDMLGSDAVSTYDSHLSDAPVDVFAVRLGKILIAADATEKGMRPSRLTLKSKLVRGSQILDVEKTHGAMIVLTDK